MVDIDIRGRKIGPNYPPLVIAEIGINHEGDFKKAVQMVDDACLAGCECVKFQCHVIQDEMIPAAQSVIPGNARESIWEIMARCAFTKEQDFELKNYVESKGMIYLCTPFSRAASDRLDNMGVSAYKIGSGECNNYPLIEHIAAFGKPVILSTGMNDLNAIRPAVGMLRTHKVPFALLHCTSIYPTPYDKLRLGALAELANEFPDAVVGLSDHSMSIFPCLGAVALGACVLERHFTSDKTWAGPDVPISMDPSELAMLIEGSRIIHQSLGGSKDILADEQSTIDFAYASVVSIRDINEGEELTMDNIWVKRPGTGEIRAREFDGLLGRKTTMAIRTDTQLCWKMVC